MTNLVQNNLSLIGTIIVGVVTWLIYAVRVKDAVDHLKIGQRELEAGFRERGLLIQAMQSELNSQKEKVADLKETAKELKTAVSELNTHLAVIASWVKLQNGDTILLSSNHRKDK